MKLRNVMTILLALMLAIPCALSAQDEADVPRSADTIGTAGEDTTFFYDGEEAEDSVMLTEAEDETSSEDVFNIQLPKWLDSWWGKFIGGSVGILGGLFGLLVVVFVLLLLLVIFTAPLWLLALLILLLVRGRNRTQGAVNPRPQTSAQPAAAMARQDEIPLNRSQETWVSGVKECCLGVGLILFFVAIDLKGLWGIGALVLCMGVAKLIISRRQKQKEAGSGEGQP